MEAFLGTSNKKKVIDVWIDGSCEPINPNGTACGGYVIKTDDKLIEKSGFVIGTGQGMTKTLPSFKP